MISNSRQNLDKMKVQSSRTAYCGFPPFGVLVTLVAERWALTSTRPQRPIVMLIHR